MSRSTKPWLGRVAVVGVAVALLACRDGSHPAHDLEERLLAPCCWKQPLSDHESETATRLRLEIESRVAAGEPADAIEADLVQRYGDRIRALPAGADPRWMIGVAATIAALLGLAWVAIVGRRRVRHPAQTATPGDPDDPYLDRLDDELAKVD
jgi:cytochrome c-type biogenesis protein CcmH